VLRVATTPIPALHNPAEQLTASWGARGRWVRQDACQRQERRPSEEAPYGGYRFSM